MLFTLSVTSPSLDALQSDILKAMKDSCFEAAGVMRDQHSKIVGNWRGKPEFRIYSYIASRSRAEGRVTISGPNAKKWFWVSNGTKPQNYYARSKRGMRFPYQGRGNSYLPKTTAESYGGPGQRVGPWTRRKAVYYRFIAARNFPGLARKMGEQGVWLAFGKRFGGYG